MATEIAKVWTTITTLDGGVVDTTGTPAANTGEYGNKEVNHYWRQETSAGANMTKFFAKERTSVANIASAGVTAPMAQMTAWKSKVATMEASSTIGAVTYPGTAPTYAREDSAGDQLPGELITGAYNYAMWLRAEANTAIPGDDPALRAKAVQIGTVAEAQVTNWSFNAKVGDTALNAGQTGPGATAERLWKNGTTGSTPGIVGH